MADSQFSDLELSPEEEKALHFEDAPPAKEEPAPEPKPETPPQPEPEPTEEPEAEPEAEDKPRRRVPLAELIEERKERQRLEKELAEHKGRTESTLKAIADRVAALKPAEPKEQPKPVDVDADPVAALKETRQVLQTIAQEREVEQRLSHVKNTVATHEQQFRAQAPDYDDALTFARQARLGELKAMGLDDVSARNQLGIDELQFSMTALNSNKNVGQALYEFAAARGYKKAAPAAEQKKEPTAEQKLDTIAKGQHAARSLGSAGGAPGNAPITMEKLVEMTPDQIGALSDDDFRRLMGG